MAVLIHSQCDRFQCVTVHS